MFFGRDMRTVLPEDKRNEMWSVTHDSDLINSLKEEIYSLKNQVSELNNRIEKLEKEKI